MNFYKIVFISILSSFIYTCVVFADGNVVASPEDVKQVKAEWEAQASASRQETYTPAWQKDFNELHIQAAALLEENARLSQENASLQEEQARFQKEVEDQESKNKSLRDEIDERKALKNDKSRKKNVDVQQQWEKKLNDKNEELAQYNRKIDFLEKKISLGNMKLKSLDTDGETDQILKIEEELDRDNAELQENNNRVAALKEKTEALSVDEKKLNPAMLNLKEEIDALRLEIAALEKSGQAAGGSNAPVIALSTEEKINSLTKKKADLQADLRETQEKITKIKNSEQMGITNQHLKKLVETISEIDAQNEQMREEIRELQENNTILKSHVKKLEYQADAINSMKGKMVPSRI